MYLAISGNIGSGKSSLTKALAERYGLRAVFEAVDENPYLEDFYREMDRYGFHSQVFFLSKRFEQHISEVNSAHQVVQDRTIFEDAGVFARNLFEQGYLKPRDWNTYCNLFDSLAVTLRKPDVLIYLRCSLPTLISRIQSRGRSYERQIPLDYLKQLNNLYENWIKDYTNSPVLVVPGDEMDFVSETKAFDWICNELEKLGFE